MIPVTKPFLPPIELYKKYIESIWASEWLTNRSPLVLELEKAICEKTKAKNLLFVANGTIAIQIAMKALNVTGEVITTPFSYVATTTSILWENCQPVFCDINPETFCIDANKIESLITPATTAILATHVYGLPCDVLTIEAIAKKHNLKVIYDAAHAFGVKYKGQNILNFGDASTCSFHATKLFHTGEGGSITAKDIEIFKQISLYHSFGHLGDIYISEGINGKNSDFHAAMGLCNLPLLNDIIAERKKISDAYTNSLGNKLQRPKIPANTDYNYAYYPVVFENEQSLLRVKENLSKNDVNTRRYFYPSLNQLPYLNNANKCPNSEDIAKRVLCLPLYVGLDIGIVKSICAIILNELNNQM